MALRYIFGRTLICRNLEVATQLARTTGLDCVTLDGDQVSSKGSLTGGYFNKSRSRLDINKVVAEMQKTETKNSKAKDVFDKVKTDIRLMKEELNLIDRNQVPKERSLTQLRASLEAMQTTMEGP